MKKILALALVLMLATVGLTFAMAEEQYYIGYSNMQLAEDFFITVSNGLKKAAEANNVKFEETIANRDAVLMTQNIEAFLMKGVDLVIDFNVLAETGTEMAARCAEQNVPMISIDCLYDGAYFFGVDNYGAGTALGEGMCEFVDEKLGGEIEYIVSLWDSQSGDVIKSRCDGVVDVLAEKYGVGEEQIVWIDSLVDDGGKAFRRFRAAAWTGPAMIAVLFLPIALSPAQTGLKVGCGAAAAFIAAACYFHVKHLLIPDVDYGVVRCQRGYNALALCMGAASMLELNAVCRGMEGLFWFSGAVLCAVSLAIVPVMDRGVRKWTA